jgi:hypothetical protein
MLKVGNYITAKGSVYDKKIFAIIGYVLVDKPYDSGERFSYLANSGWDTEIFAPLDVCFFKEGEKVEQPNFKVGAKLLRPDKSKALVLRKVEQIMGGWN